MPRVRLKINSWDRKILIGDEAKVLLRAESWRGSFRVSMETVFPISSVSLLLLLSLSIYLHAHTLPLSLLSPSVPFLPPSLPVSLYPSSSPFFSPLSLSRVHGAFTQLAPRRWYRPTHPLQGAHLVPGQPPPWKPTSPSFVTILRFPTTPYRTIATTTTTTTVVRRSIHSGRKSVIVESRGCFNSLRAEGRGKRFSRQARYACVWPSLTVFKYQLPSLSFAWACNLRRIRRSILR